MKKATCRKICILGWLVLGSLCLSGCWDSHELNTLAIVSGLGWDIDPATGEVTLTYQSIVPSEIKNPSSSTDGGGEQKDGGTLNNIRLEQDTGSSPYDVLNRYTQHASRLPFYQHTRVYVFGREGAEYGIYGFLDTINRNPVGRPNALILIAENKASDIMGIQDGMENIQAFGMADEIKLSAEFTKYPLVNSLEFTDRLMSQTTAPIAPLVSVFDESRPGEPTIRKIRITGTAVFNNDRMIGQLNERESSGLLWATDKVKTSYVNIPEASLEILEAKSKISPELQGNNVKITIEIRAESNLVEYKNRQELTPDIITELENDQAEEIESQVRAAVEKSLALNADVFGFGEAVHRKYKEEWKRLKPDWGDIYPRLEVVVNVKTHLNAIGDINNALLKY